MRINLSLQQKKCYHRFINFVSHHVDPFADQWDIDEKLPTALFKQLAVEGILGAAIPDEYGGLNLDPLLFGLLCEELGRGSISLVSMLTVHSMFSHVISRWGTDKQKKTFLPKLAAGKLIGAFALSEPLIGSDPKSIETTAVQNSSGIYLLNGRKKWISCGQIADYFLVFVQVNKKPTAFLLGRDTVGLAIKPIKGMYACRAAMLAELIFTNCKVNEHNIIGRVGFGFSHVANTALDFGRFAIAWSAVGLGQACLNASLDYTNKRKQFGIRIRKHQLIQKMIADMAVNLNAARALCIQAAQLKKAGEPDLIMETSIAKYFSSCMAVKAANDAMQIHGANGYSQEFSVQRYLRDAKVLEVIEGSSQIQQIIISQYAYQRFLFNREEKIEQRGADGRL
jgi:hypothetical protein